MVRFPTALLVPVLLAALLRPVFAMDRDWSLYGGEGGRRFSSLTQISRANVARVRQAWRFDMAELGDPQTHPLAIGGVVYAYTPALDTIALDGASGKLLWRFHSGVKAGGPQRGFWPSGVTARNGACSPVPEIFSMRSIPRRENRCLHSARAGALTCVPA